MSALVERCEAVKNDQSNPTDSVAVELILVPSPLAEEKSAERSFDPQSGKIGWALLWLLGIPLPVLIAVYLIWGR